METLEQVTREGQRRLHPSITDPSWLILEKRRRIFEDWLNRLPARGLNVLDVGGRIQPYRPLIANSLGSYVSVDLRRTPLTEVVASAEQLPFPANSFDLVICTQVLQYIPEPKQALCEMARVIKPGGYIFLSVPSACPTDADEECWRFFPAALRHLLTPFREIEIVAEGSSVTGFFRTANVCFSLFARYPVLRSLCKYSLFPLLNLMGAGLERLYGGGNQQFTPNYSVLARK
jgi:SAM-dependent methyltransferase